MSRCSFLVVQHQEDPSPLFLCCSAVVDLTLGVLTVVDALCFVLPCFSRENPLPTLAEESDNSNEV